MKKHIYNLYFIYFIVMIQIMFTGMAYAEGSYVSALAGGMCALVTFLIAKDIRKRIGI